MKKYYAISEIGGYKVGEEVPKEKGELWLFMYKYPPVRVVEVPDDFSEELDLNKDGKFDKRDSVVASKVLNKVKEDKKKKIKR